MKSLKMKMVKASGVSVICLALLSTSFAAYAEETETPASKTDVAKQSEEVEPVEVKEVAPCPMKKDHHHPGEISPCMLPRWIDVSALMQSVALWQNDSDFDPTEPKYNEEGQSVGLAATIFQPKVTFHIGDQFKLYYEAEVGLNMWSKNNPDEYDPTADDAFFMKHREMWSSGSFYGDRLGFKVGYQRYLDTTGLFLNHWMGAGTVYGRFGDGKLYFTVGQVPDTTYEGFVITENNFKHDTFTANLYADSPLLPWMKAGGGIFSLFDNHIAGRDIMLFNPALHLGFEFDRYAASLDYMLQIGTSDFAAEAGNATITAWALQAHGDLNFDFVSVYLNALYLTPDDSYDRNDSDGAFFYSGKNNSATVILTEDEIRDRVNNMDERMGAKDGGFYRLRQGLAIADAKVEGKIGRIFRPALIAGTSFAPRPSNALDSSYVGSEFDLDLCVRWREILELHLLGGAFIPGGAAAAIINSYDRQSKEPQFLVESAVNVNY